MLTSVIIALSTCALMITSILFFPSIKLGKIKIDAYWIVALLGALAIFLFGVIDFDYFFKAVTKNTSVNPLKILVLFVSMTFLSIFLDEIGFFRYLANQTLRFSKGSQFRLFTTLYFSVSFLTVFTSNDIIVLTFTPFICYFCKNAEINPVPYLICEFVGANTLSMMLIIGNPTNIYLATYYDINFIEYLRVMFLPTIVSALVAYGILCLIFRKQLKKPSNPHSERVIIENIFLLIVGLLHLGVCTIMLAVSSFIGVEMWLVSLISAISLFVISTATCLVKKRKLFSIKNVLKRVPWQLIPFMLSMFTLVLAVSYHGVTDAISSAIGSSNLVFKYGIASFLSANVINNIPMSVLFCELIAPLQSEFSAFAVYSSIVGSNLGALLTPIGALAGIMWIGMLKDFNIKLSFVEFVKYGVVISFGSLIPNLLILNLIL